MKFLKALILVSSFGSIFAGETRDYTGDTNDLQFIDALGQGHIFTADSLHNTSGNHISVNFVPENFFDQKIPRAVLGAFSVDEDLSYNQVIFNQGAAAPGIKWFINDNPTIHEGSVFGAFSINGQVIENTVEIKNSAFDLGDVFGGYSRHGLAQGNKLILNGGDAFQLMGGKSNTGSAVNNSVVINQGKVSFGVYGGVSMLGHASGNSVVVSSDYNGNIPGIKGGVGLISSLNNYIDIYNGNFFSVIGGESYGLSSGNIVDFRGGSTSRDLFLSEFSRDLGGIIGGYSSIGDSSNNTVNVYWSEINGGNVYGGLGFSAQGNVVFFYDGKVKDNPFSEISFGSVVGGMAYGDNANFNYVSILGGEIEGNVYGGQSQTNVYGNIVNVSGGHIIGNLSAAYINAAGGEAKDNHLLISGGVMSSTVSAVHTQENAIVSNNKLEISGGHIFRDVITAHVGPGSHVVDNELLISGGSFFGDVYLAQAWNSEEFTASNNKITLMEDFIITGQVRDTFNANTQLIFHNFRGNIYGGIDINFDTFEFIVSKNALNIIPENALNIYDRYIKLKSIAPGEYFQVGDVSVLLANASWTDSIKGFSGSGVPSGATLLYDFEKLDSSDSLAVRVVNIRANPQLKSLSESQLGALAFLNQNSDQLSIATRSLSDRAKNSDKQWLKFSEVSGGSSRYQTGSHVDVSGVSLLTGIARRLGHSSILGMFAEGGWSSYNTVNPMGSEPDVRSDGHVNFLGGGLIARHDFKKGAYVDAALRLGQVSTQFDSADISYEAGPTSFQTKALYYGAMLGFGHRWNLGDRFVLDASSHQVWNRQAGNRVNVSGDPNPVDLHAIQSHRMRGQVRLDYQGQLLSPYLSLAYEHEFKGQANASVNGFSVPAPSLQGGTGIGGLGIKIQSSLGKSFVHAGIQGFVGKRQGFALMMNAGLVF